MEHWLLHTPLILLRAILKGLIRLPLCLALGFLGYYVWQEYVQPWPYIAGLPLMLLGGSAGLFSLYDLMVALISSKWRRQHCPYCSSVKRVEEILSPQNGFRNR